LSASSIRASILAMRSASGMSNPLLEASTGRDGSRLAFRHSGSMVEPITRQLVFDFELDWRRPRVLNTASMQAAREVRVTSMFLEAVQLEERSRVKEAGELYQQILEIDAAHAPANINLGTILYNQREFAQAERLYRRAAEADPEYALAYFDLGNVLDELQRLPESVGAYREAIRLVPNYADAHYNLALAYERTGERRRALRHWTAYLKLDPIGPWANHARGQARKILEREKLTIVHRSPRISVSRSLFRSDSAGSPELTAV
jgi:tetratricopeptide (TPR) repeat protein